MKYLCGCDDGRPSVDMSGNPIDDYRDYLCFACKSYQPIARRDFERAIYKQCDEEDRRDSQI